MSAILPFQVDITAASDFRPRPKNQVRIRPRPDGLEGTPIHPSLPLIPSEGLARIITET